MKNKVCIITGATSGMGFEAAKSLSHKGFQVVLACRNSSKAHIASENIIKETGNPYIYPITLDLSSFRSIERFAYEFNSKFNKLDLLINNAGVICDRYSKTEQGFEMTMGVNYLGHYYLTELLLPTIIKTTKSRIINVSSIVGINSNLQDEILDFYSINYGMRAYCASKLAQILYTLDLSERLRDHDTTAITLHPGVIGTNIWSGEGILMKLTNPLMKLVFPSPKHGAKNIVYLATSPDVSSESGTIFIKCKKIEPRNSSLNIDLRKKLIKQTKISIKEVTQCQKNIAI